MAQTNLSELSAIAKKGALTLWKRTIAFGEGDGDGTKAQITVATIPRDVRVIRAYMSVVTAFDGTGDLASIGHTGDVDFFIDTTLADIGNADTGIGADSWADAQPGSTIEGRAPQTAEYDVICELETNSDTTTGSLTVHVWGFQEDA